jgi:predicted DNA-binding transcriptional regulator AlpA
MENEVRYLNENETALLTGLSVQTLRNNRCQGKLFPYRKIGRSVRYLKSEIISFMEHHKVTPQGEDSRIS